MVQFVESDQVLGQNGRKFIYLNYITGKVSDPSDPRTLRRQLAVDNMVIVNSYWWVPKVQNGHVIDYTELTAINTNIRPTPDSIKILRLKDKQDQSEYDIAIALVDNTTIVSSPPLPTNMFAYLADGLGGTLPVMPTVTIPFPIIQFDPSSVSGGNNTFTFVFPSNPLGLLYSIPAPWFNGAAGSPAYSPAGITTAAQFVTWATSNWSAYGTWASTGDVVTLVCADTNVTKAGMVIALTPANYCFDLTAYSTPALVNQVKFGTTGTLISIPAFNLTNDPTVLINALNKIMSAESTTYGTAIAHKLQVNTVYDVPKLYVNGVLVVSSTAAVCS
jgi:hypothetical protein